MLRFIARRLVGLLISLWMVASLTFIAVHLVPGDPAEAALSQSTASEDVIERRREALGLDQPLGVQYTRYLTQLAQGDFGVSWSAGQPVILLIAQQFPATARLALASLTVAIIVGVMLGIGGALGGGKWVGQASRSLTGLFLAVPVMVSGTVLIWVFAILLSWLPATGQGGLRFLILPALVVGLSTSGGIARTVEAGVGEALRQPFMRLARAKGLTRVQATVRHALRVGLLPTLDIVALQFGFLLGGAVVTEAVFARQGLGRLLLFAVLDKDLPVVQGIVILSAVLYTVLNALSDIAKAALDPRIRPGVE